MVTVLLEQVFDPPMSDEAYGKLAQRLDPCLEVRDACWCRSYVSADRKRVICEFEARDAESVREALRTAGLPFERVWTAASVTKIEDYPELVTKRDAMRARRT